MEFGAGRGGKTLMIASRAVQACTDVELFAVDTHSPKLEALRADAQRLGLKGVTTVVGDATRPETWTTRTPAEVDVVLVDAPCSGLGTLRRHPDRRWRARPDEIDSLASLGASLLTSAASLVKPGGFVVYSTCTVTRKENHDVVASFLASQAGSEFTTDPLNDIVPGEWSTFMTPEGWFQAIPAVGGPDGHFVARLRRKD
jgi:16S rRNA (cytosine967-C5)-methyltransferase